MVFPIADIGIVSSECFFRFRKLCQKSMTEGLPPANYDTSRPRSITIYFFLDEWLAWNCTGCLQSAGPSWFFAECKMAVSRKIAVVTGASDLALKHTQYQLVSYSKRLSLVYNAPATEFLCLDWQRHVQSMFAH